MGAYVTNQITLSLDYKKEAIYIRIGPEDGSRVELL